MNEITCCVCGKKTSKRKTLEVKNGERACRSHEDTVDKASQLQTASKAAIEESRRKASRRWERPPQINESDLLQPKCFSCRKPGLVQQKFYLQMLIGSEQFELTYGRPPNPFSQDDAKLAYSELKDKVCLWYVAYNDKIKLPYNAKMGAQLFGVLLLCHDCCDKNGIDPNPVSTDLTLDQLYEAGTVYEMFYKPTIQNLAKKRINEQKLG